MRPTHLSIEGLTAFRALQEIDFADLDLFVITGPTGSGKTSILDAITFALYGDVCRVKSGELRDLISHGATHIKVSLDFRINGTRYRVARRMKKAGAGHDVQFVRVDGDHEVPVCETSGVTAVNKSIEETLGLDFSAFTKAVLLPQGAFHEFLKGDAGARRKILIDLLDLNLYLSAGARARSHANTLTARLDEREKLIESEYADATTERLKAAKKDAKAAKDAYKEFQAIESKAKEQAAAAEAGEATARVASSAGEAFRELADDLGGYAQELAAINTELNARKTATSEAAREVAAAEKRRAGADAAVVKAIADGGDEAAIALLQSAAESRATERANLRDLNEELADATKAVAATDEAHAAAHAATKNAELTRTRAEKNEETAKAKLERAIALLEYARATADEKTARTQVEAVDQERETAEAVAEVAKAHLRHLQRAELAATLRLGLKPGDACPVCDAAIATIPKVKRDAAQVLKAAESAAADADKKRLEAERSCAAATTTHDASVIRLNAAKAALPAGTKPITVADAESSAAAAEKAAATAEESLVSAQTALTEAERRAAGTDAARRETKVQAEGLQKEVRGATQRLEKAEGELRGGFPAKLPTQIEMLLAKRLEKLSDARHAAASAAEAVTAAQKTSAEAVAAQHQTEELLADLEKRFTETRTRAEASLQTLEQVNGTPLPPLPQASASLDGQIENLTASCAKYIDAARDAEESGGSSREKALRALAAMLAPLELELDGDLTNVLSSLGEQREEIHTNLVEAGSLVELVNKKILRRTELEKEVKNDTIRRDRYKMLGQELHQNNFIEFVLLESMERLASLASVELLRISGDRYRLVAEKSGFDAIDHHNADERRSVATLSGGETFLASLALALALAGSVRDLAGTAAAARLDSIFIDEGFGALDPETLDVVLDALERLREGERMVGVISHVEELAQRIPQGLVVSKNGAVSTVASR